MSDTTGPSTNTNSGPDLAHDSRSPRQGRSKLEDEIFKSRVIIQRLVKSNLSKGIPLSGPEANQLSQVVRFCGKLGENAQPFIEKWSLIKALRHVLRASQVLPDFLPPQIQIVLDAWNRNEYNLAPAENNAISDDTDESE